MIRFATLAAGLTIWLATGGALAATPGSETPDAANEAEETAQPAGPPVEEIDPRTMFLQERLYLTLRDAPGGDGERVGLLKSGDRLTQTARRGDYARVETPDGTVGWVAARFLTRETPTSARLEQAQQEAEALRRQLGQARQTVADTKKALGATREKLAAARERAETASGTEPKEAAETGNAALEARIEELENALATARERAARLENARSDHGDSISGRWTPARIGILGGLLGLAFGLGAAVGVRWHSKRTRERLGGLKL